MFSALSESSLSSLDLSTLVTVCLVLPVCLLHFSNNASAAGALVLNPQPSSLTVLPTAPRGFLDRHSSGTTNVSSVTAAAASVDKVVLGAGSVALFTTKGGTEYPFMQGGSSSTSDDAIVQFEGLSAKSIAAGGSAAVVTFSGVDS